MIKIISGGQTGVDRAALDAATRLKFHKGGWCPKGRIDENGTIPERYFFLKEVSGKFSSEFENYSFRTRKNILCSDGTVLIIPTLPLPENIKDGTLLTISFALHYSKPIIYIDLSKNNLTNVYDVKKWMHKNQIQVLNIAGPRESTCPGIYQKSLRFIMRFLQSIGVSHENLNPSRHARRSPLVLG